ncbi:Palmitoylated plasma membrane-bound casein kinase [Collariella sp. IMI 366227]|nr:Palmitoylated plasma membrane-bound casein kinase [Collariella sp. IMI 366227]
MDLLGPSIEDMFRERKWKFTVKTVAMLAKRMLRVVEFVHKKGLVHRDLKPENFLLGRQGTPTANEIYLVDFGMAKQYRDPKTQEHIPYREKQPLSGTPRYMSINTHLGQEQSRRDDLETLYHVWLYFLKGSLPWQRIKAATKEEKRMRIGEKKQETTTNDLCAGFPEEFSEGLEYVRGLRFEDQPDYNHIQDLLSRVLRKAGEVDDGEFDWVKAGEKRPIKLAIRLPTEPVGGNAAPPAPPTAIGMTGKRPRTDSVPDPGQSRARRPPVLLHRIHGVGVAKTASIKEAPGDCQSS